MREKMAGKFRIALLLLFFITMLFPVSVLAAQEPEFRLDADSLNLKKGTGNTIVVSLINAQDAEIVSIEGLEDFDIISQSSSSSTSIINNIATYRVDYYYTVMPKVTGQFTLKANIGYNGKSYETNYLPVTVSESTGGESPPDLFVKTVLSREEAYLGEKIILTYELYTRVDIDSCGFTDYTAIDGVVSKNLPNDQLKSGIVYVDGDRYSMYEIRKMILDPMKAGECIIPSFNVQVNVVSSGGGGFGFGSLFQTTTPIYLQTEEKGLIVKPLPAEGRPDNFSGIVGEVTLNGYYSRNELNYGDSVALQMSISGSGNLDGLKSITGGEMPGFTVYENQKNMTEYIEGDKYYVQKSYEAILIPEKNGELETHPIILSYFNPVSEKYETTGIPGEVITVHGDMPAPTNGSYFGNTETVRINQVNYAETDDGIFTLRFQKKTLFAVLIGFASLSVLGTGLILLTVKLRKGQTKLKSLYKQFTGAKDRNEIYNLFNAMIKHCYNVSLKSNSRNVIMSSIADGDLCARAAEVMDYMESPDVRTEKGIMELKSKIKVIYRTKLRKLRGAAADTVKY